MATVKIRLKGASGNVLHPETDWSIVLNRPSITVDSKGQIWDVSGSDMRLKANRIYIEDSTGGVKLLAEYPINWSAVQNRPTFNVNTDGETWGTSGSSIRLSGNKIYVKDYRRNEILLENYPIKWFAISGKPNYLDRNEEDKVFGYYSTVERVDMESQTERGNVYPAIRYYEYYSGPIGESYTYHSRYWSGSSWLEVPNEEKFIPLV